MRCAFSPSADALAQRDERGKEYARVDSARTSIPTSRFRPTFRLIAALTLIAIAATACEPGGDEVSDDNPIVRNAPPSATSGVAPPERAEEAALTIADGKFSDDRLTVQQDEPTVVHITNKDSQVYRVRFGDVIAEEEIASAGITDVSFTAPNPVEIEAQLLEADSDKVLDTIQFVVRAPGGTEP
jgi:hypothetical protein